MDFVLVQELVEGGKSDVVFFELLCHRVDVLNEFKQEDSHLLGGHDKLHDLGLP